MKKILLLLCTLLAGVSGVWAVDLTLTPGNGTYVTSSGNYVNSITFGTTPAITVTASANNMDKRQTGDYLLWHSGSSGSSTYTISVGDDYVITSYSVTGEANTSAQTLTAGSNSHEFAVGTSSSFTVTGLEASSASFVQTGANASGLKITSITVTVAKPSDEQIAAYNTVQNWIPTIQGAKGLVKDASNYISNAKSSAEGTYAALLDGEYTTYFHGAYGSEGPDEDQYLQATLSSAVDAIYFYYKKRSQNNNNRPTSITIYGSNDGSTFTNITTISSGLPTDGSVLDYTSSKISLGASYQYLRFTVTATNNNATNSSGHVFFTFSEFYILPSDNTIDDVMDLHAALAGTSVLNYTAQNIADVTAANTALLSTVVNVTYNLYESDGTTLVATESVEQEKNSAISIPSSMSAYTYYDYTTEGTIGTEDCTIKVTRTLKAGYVISLDGLSNSKCYNIRNNRATWAVGSGATVVNSTSELGLAFLSSDVKQQFAFITYDGNVYLYSVGEGKFAYVDGTKLSLSADVTSAVEASPVTFQASTNATYKYSEPIIVTVAGNHFGVSTGYSPDIYKYNSQGDGGNCAYIIEAGSFDATAALALLEEYFHPTNCYDRVEADVLPFLMDGNGDPSPTIGKPFGLSVAAATSITQTYLTQLENKQFTLEEYEAILAAKNAGIIYPEVGKFYLVKNNYNGMYMRVTASGTRGSVFADLTAEEAAKDASAHFCFTAHDSQLYMTTQGEYLNWVYGTYNGYEGLTSTNFDKYVHFANPGPGVGAFSIAYGNGVGDYAGYLGIGFYALKDTETKVVAGSPTDQTHERAQWTFEEVTTFDITLNAVGAESYATTYLPFGVTLDGDVQAYVLIYNNPKTYVVPTAYGQDVPAGMPVLLCSNTGVSSVTATIDNSIPTSDIINELRGSYFASTPDAYVLNAPNGELGFWLLTSGATLAANRAYLPKDATSNVKGFVLSFDALADGINAVDNAQIDSKEIYNLAGQRMSKLQKGVNIVNGKKVMVK